MEATTHVRYELHNPSGNKTDPRDLTESDRDLFKAFQSVIADQIRLNYPNLPPFDDSKLDPTSVSTEIHTDSRFHFHVQLPNGCKIKASIIQPLGVPVGGGKIERGKMVEVELIE